MAGEHRMPLARTRHPKRGLEPIAQCTKHRAVEAVHRTRHDHHDRLQEIHRPFGVHAGDPRGRTGDVGEQHGRLLALARHVGLARVGFSRLTAPGAESGRFREIPPAVGAHWSEGGAAGHAGPTRGLVVVSACPASHRESAVYWITAAGQYKGVRSPWNSIILALKKPFRYKSIAFGPLLNANGRK